jgi:hypothetical protein
MRFLVSERVNCSGGSFEVHGICAEGEIKVGDTFTLAVAWGERESRSIGIRVDRILAYRRELQELSEGVSGVLNCSSTTSVVLAVNESISGLG